MKDEKWYTFFGPYRSSFLVTLIWWFFYFARLPSLNKMCYQRKIFTKISKINLLRYSNGNPKKRENLPFLIIFSTKTRHNFAVVLATSIKVGFKVKYNSYIWWIGPFKKTFKKLLQFSSIFQFSSLGTVYGKSEKVNCR
jgi:hypothetical protein